MEYRCFHCGKVLRDEEGVRTELGGGNRVLPWLFEEPGGVNRRANMVDLCPACHGKVQGFRRIKAILALLVFAVVMVIIAYVWTRQY